MSSFLSLNPDYDELLVSLHQLDAMFDVATSIDMTELKPETLSNYFWVVRDILDKAKINCESLANSAFTPQSVLEGSNHAN